MTRRWIWMLVALLATLLVACAAPGPRTTTISQERLQSLVAARFPYTGKLGAVLELRAQQPQVRLDPEKNRIGTTIQVQVSDRLGRSTFNGVWDVDYGLRFEPGDNSIRMADVHVNSFNFSGVPERYHALVEKYVQTLAERMLNDASLHQLRAKDMETIQGWGYEPGAIDVTPEGLRITLQPRQKP